MPKKALVTPHPMNSRAIAPVNVIIGDNCRIGSIIHLEKHWVRAADIMIALGYSPTTKTLGCTGRTPRNASVSARPARGKNEYMPFIGAVSSMNAMLDPITANVRVNGGWFVNKAGALEIAEWNKLNDEIIHLIFKSASEQFPIKSDKSYSTKTMLLGLVKKASAKLASVVTSKAA